MGGNDTLQAGDFASSTSVVIAGGDGNDQLTGGELTQDVLVDGPGDDQLAAAGGDDALLNNGGADQASGGGGNDLFLSNSICDGDTLTGGDGRDNASWAKFQGSGIEAHLAEGLAGRPGGGGPECAGGSFDSLAEIEDLEGTTQGDVLYGDANSNQLLGWAGPDVYHANAGDDTILANSGDADPMVDCGDGADTALIDRPPIVDIVDASCELVREADPNSFRSPDLPSSKPDSPLVPDSSPLPPAAIDTTPPNTRITRRAPKTIWSAKRWVRVTIAFSSTEGAGTFVCKLDHKPFRACSSPVHYSVKRGRHTVRIAAVDAAGNRDPVPAKLFFRVRSRRS